MRLSLGAGCLKVLNIGQLSSYCFSYRNQRVRAPVLRVLILESLSVNVSDPTPIIEQAIVWKSQAEKTNIAVEEANHLRAQIAQVNSELADLKSQGESTRRARASGPEVDPSARFVPDVTIRQLRDTIKQLEEEKTREVEKAIDEIERDLREEFSVRDMETTMRSDKLKAENSALEKKVGRWGDCKGS